MGFPSKQVFRNPKLVQLGEAIAANYSQSVFDARMELEERRTRWEDHQEQLKMDALNKELDAKYAAELAMREAAEQLIFDANIGSASMMTSEQIKKAAFVERMRLAREAKKAAKLAVTA